MPEIEINGVTTAYDIEGEGEPVVLVHGFTASRDMWFGQVPALEGAGFKAIAYDVRGHGDSGRPVNGYNAVTLADDLAALLDALGIEKAHVVGLSMGGIIAQRFCLDHPERVATLTVADSFPGRPDPETLYTFRGEVDIVKASGLTGLFNHLMKNPAMPVGPGFQVPLELMDVFTRNFLKNDPFSLARFVEMFNDLPDWSSELSSIECPTLLVVGELDLPCLGPMHRMSEIIPYSELHEITSAGHSSPAEKPAEFNELLVAFLDRNKIRGSSG